MEIDEKNLEKILDRQRKEFQEVVDESFDRRTKKIIVEQRKEFERHIGALAEDFSGQLKGVAENVIGLHESMGNVQEMVAKNTEDIDVIKGSMNLMQSDIDVMKSDISTIKFDLKNKVDLDELKPLEKRVLFLERKTSHA